MIRINLLPSEFRIAEIKTPRFPLQATVIVVLFIFLFVSLIQFFFFLGVRKKLRNLNAEMTQLSTPGQEANKLDLTIGTKLAPEKYFLDQYVLPTFLMAEVLNILSDLLPDNIWLSNLVLKREQGTIRLDLTGYSRITYQQIAAAQIQEYINAVKSQVEKVIQKSQPEMKQEVKAVLTTNLQRDVSGSDAMQFAVSFKSTALPFEKKG